MASAKILVAAAALVAAFPMPRASATDAAAGYLASANGRPVLDSAGGCWHTREWRSASYNRALSERRADAVRDYLAAHGFDAQRIRTEGLGSVQPVISLAQCKGLPRERLIQCLQPDRYAQITVLGTAHTVSAK